MESIKIVHDGPFYHQGTKIDLGNGDYDEVCAFCGHFCTTRSICSNRYNFIQGTWTRAPPNVQTIDPVDLIAVCDMCYDQYNFGDHGNGPNAIVFYNRRDASKSYTFDIDCNFRAND